MRRSWHVALSLVPSFPTAAHGTHHRACKILTSLPVRMEGPKLPNHCPGNSQPLVCWGGVKPKWVPLGATGCYLDATGCYRSWGASKR